jgi:hypothetical protein
MEGRYRKVPPFFLVSLSDPDDDTRFSATIPAFLQGRRFPATAHNLQEACALPAPVGAFVNERVCPALKSKGDVLSDHFRRVFLDLSKCAALHDIRPQFIGHLDIKEIGDIPHLAVQIA